MIPTLAQLRQLGRFVLYSALVVIILFSVVVLNVVVNFGGDAIFPTDCALVFGAAVHSKEDPGPGITRRVETAAELYKQGHVKTVYLTGGKGDEFKESEAQVMRKVAMLEGIDPEDLILEEDSSSTWENLNNSWPLIAGCESVVAISDRYHLARIEYLAERQGWGTLMTYPAQRTAPLRFEAKSVLREAVGFVYYFFNRSI